MIAWVSYQTFVTDVLAWAEQLPGPYGAVVGIPRSGLVPASLLALRWNTRLVDLQQFKQDPQGSLKSAPLRENNPISEKPPVERVLVVDDSSSSGVSLKVVRDVVSGHPAAQAMEVHYAAVYADPGNTSVDHCYRRIAQPRIFEWNWFRHFLQTQSLWDIDGVLCCDWAQGSEQDQDPVYQRHVAEAKPLFLPSRQVLGLVTSRLERYREATEAWLQRHGVRYGSLTMHPAQTPEERRRQGDHARRKADVYQASDQALLFVESSARQAEEIARSAGKPVLCLETRELFQA